MTEEQKEALLKYEQLKIEVKKLEEMMEPLKEIILPIMSKDEDIKGENGTFQLRERAKWTFSESVKKQEETVEELKADEIARGVAVKSVTSYLQYNLNK